MGPLVPVWILASLVSAALAHVLIGWTGALAGGDADAYDTRAHAALIPVVFASAALLAASTAWIVAVSAARHRAVDPVALLAARFGRLRPAVAVAAVAAGTAAALLGMEFSEQLAATGRIEGVVDALGGAPLPGAGLLLATAAAIALLGLRTAAAFITGTAAATLAVLAVLRARGRRTGVVRAWRATAVPFAIGRRFARAHGLRAPPRPA